MSRTTAPIKFAGSILQGFRHVCAFFGSAADEYRTILPFTVEGLQAGERIVHVLPEDRSDHIDRLRAAGVDVDRARERHQLVLLVSEQTYLANRQFDPVAMLDLIEKILISGRRLGFPLTRIVAHAEHTVQNAESMDSFLEYESRLTSLLAGYPDPVVCTYDLHRVSAGVVVDVMRTHPMAIVGGILQGNPFYLRVDKFRSDIAKRRLGRPELCRGSGERHSNTRHPPNLDLFIPDSSGPVSHGHEA